MSSNIYNTLNKKVTKCTICFNDISDPDIITMLKCGHYFHKKCINIWFETTNYEIHIYNNSNKCPYCRC